MKAPVLAVVFALAAAGPGRGSHIAVNVKTRVTVVGESNLIVRVEGRNSGDEPAYNVRMDVLFPDGRATHAAAERLDPGGRIEHTFERRLADDPRRGQRILPGAFCYADVNGSEFTALFCGRAALAGAADPRVGASMEPLSMARSGRLRLRAHSLDGRSHTVSVGLFLPKELAARSFDRPVRVPAEGEAVVELDLRNVSALPGSRYTVWAVIRELDEPAAAEGAVSGTIDVVAPRRQPVPSIRVLLLVCIGSGFVLYVLARLRRRGPGLSGAP